MIGRRWKVDGLSEVKLRGPFFRPFTINYQPSTLLPLLGAEVDELFHDVVEIAGPVGGAEGVVKGFVESVKLLVDGDVFGNGVVDFFADGGHAGLQVGDGVGSGGGGTEDGGSEGAGLFAAADFHGAVDDVGVDLHHGFVFDGEAAGVDDFLDGDAVLFDSIDDGEGSKGGGLDVGAVDFVGFGVEGLADEQSGQARVDQDGAVAVVPVEGEEAAGTGFLIGDGFAHGGKFFVVGAAVGFGDEVIDEPQEDVADGALAGLDAVVAVEDGTVDDAADAGDVGEGFVVGSDHDVAGAGADDFDESSIFDAGSDGAHVGIHGSDGDGGAFGEAETLGPFGTKAAGFLISGLGAVVKAVAEVGEGGIELGEEFFAGKSAPFFGEHGFVSGGADAAGGGKGIGAADEDGGQPVAVFQNAEGGVEYGGVDAAESEDFAPEPFGRIDAAAFGHDVGSDLVAEGGDFCSFGVGGVVFPQPDHGVEVVGELREEPEGNALFVDENGGAAGGVDADADDLGGVEVGDGVAGLLKSAEDDGLESVQVVLGILAGDVGIAWIGEDAHVAAGVVEGGGADFASVGDVNKKGAAGVGAKIEA